MPQVLSPRLSFWASSLAFRSRTARSKSRARDLHGAVTVAVLRALVLAGNHDPRGQVGDADGRIGDVDVLAALPARPKGVDAQVVLVHLDLDAVVQVRKSGYRSERGVAAVLGVEGGHPNQPVDA